VTELDLEAVRDALALLRAVHAEDEDGIEAVARNMADPPMTAVVLAEMLSGAMDAGGDRLAVIDAWQRQAGL
jgi:hypothetical protein